MQNETTTTSQGSMPVWENRNGQVKVTVWKGTYGNNYVVTKSYMDKKTNSWKETKYLNADEANKTIALLTEALQKNEKKAA